MQKRKRRLELLKLQEQLNDGHCVGCEKFRKKDVAACPKCPIYKQLVAIGNELNPPAEADVIVVNKSAKQILKESKTKHGLVLTKERLQNLLDLGYKNGDIAKLYGISAKELNEWKKYQGLTKKRGPEKEADIACCS